MTAVQIVESEIAAGHQNSDVIEWFGDKAGLFGDVEHSPEESIWHARSEFVHAGWKWNQEQKRLEKNGWYAFFRSQGMAARPIIQWARIEVAE